jgi:hypothetical protein
VNLRPPRPSKGNGSEPVFEHFAKTAVGVGVLVGRYLPRCDPEVFGELAPFHRIWRDKLQGDTLPRWSDFSFEDFRGLHRNVALSEINAASADWSASWAREAGNSWIWR